MAVRGPDGGRRRIMNDDKIITDFENCPTCIEGWIDHLIGVFICPDCLGDGFIEVSK